MLDVDVGDLCFDVDEDRPAPAAERTSAERRR
jgi:hypothetical protein